MLPTGTSRPTLTQHTALFSRSQRFFFFLFFLKKNHNSNHLQIILYSYCLQNWFQIEGHNLKGTKESELYPQYQLNQKSPLSDSSDAALWSIQRSLGASALWPSLLLFSRFLCLAPFHYSDPEFKDTFLNMAFPDILSSFTALITICKIIYSLET